MFFWYGRVCLSTLVFKYFLNPFKVLYTVCTTRLLFQHIWADTTTSKEEIFCQLLTITWWKFWMHRISFYVTALMHNNPKVCINKTSQKGNKNIAIKWVPIEKAKSGRRGEVLNDWGSSVRVSSSKCSVTRNQKESKLEEVWADRVRVRWRTLKAW